MEEQAKVAKRGLWSQPSPIPPWDFRKGEIPEGKAVWVGNRNSKVYHRPGCPNGGRIGAKNRVEFPNAEAAEQGGYRPGKDCHKEP